MATLHEVAHGVYDADDYTVYLVEHGVLHKCVCPDCKKLVNHLAHSSGACCREHMNYVCGHPECVEYAKVAGWKHYTHRYGTKIAADHLEYRQPRALP